MNRWVLLEHKILDCNLVDIHYDFLLEDQLDCLTWKFNKIPLINECSVEIAKQPNHRLIWLNRVEHELSNDRGLVKRIDYGTFKYISKKLNSQEITMLLSGNLLNGLFIIEGNFCRLSKNN